MAVLLILTVVLIWFAWRIERSAALRMLVAMGVAIALLSACVILSRTAPRLPSAYVGLPLTGICVIWGAIPILRLKVSLLGRVALGLAYIVVASCLLLSAGFLTDCYVFHDCD